MTVLRGIAVTRDLEQVPRALRERDERIAALDADIWRARSLAARTSAARRGGAAAEARAQLAWSQAQVSAMANGENGSSRVAAAAPWTRRRAAGRVCHLTTAR
jgi:hypothetical protein